MGRFWRQLLLFLAVTVSVTGCAQPPRYVDVAASVPPVAPWQARIYAYREPGVYEGLDWVPILLNGQQAGAVGPGQVIMRDVVPGTYSIEAASQGVYPGQTKVVALAPGQTIYVKVTTLRGMIPTSRRDRPAFTYIAVLMDPAIARQEIAGLAYTAG